MVFASGFPADVANRKDGDVPFDDGYLCDFLTAPHMLFTGSFTATTIKSRSSSNQELRSFTPGCVQPLPGGALIKLYGNDHVLAQEIHKQDGQELPKNRYDGYP